MEKLKKYPLFNKWTLVIVLFSLIQGLCLIHHSDDLYWFQGSIYNNIFSSNSDNSKYFTNIITFLISSNSLCRIIIYTIFLSSLFIIIAKIVNGTHWAIFENTHEAIISKEDFDLVQELRKNKRNLQHQEEVNPFSGMVYCADCGKKMYLCRSKRLNADQEHLKYSSYAKDKDDCSAHFIRTVVLEEIVLSELRKMTTFVRENEADFLQSAYECSQKQQSAELKAAKKRLAQSEKRVAELDKLFTRLYEDNVSGKISDERFEIMSKNYETEQKELRQIISELSQFIEVSEQKNADTAQFIGIVRKYSKIPKLTPGIMHEFIEKIVVHAPDKSSGHRTQQIDICFRFNVAVATAVADSMVYDKKRKAV